MLDNFLEMIKVYIPYARIHNKITNWVNLISRSDFGVAYKATVNNLKLAHNVIKAIKHHSVIITFLRYPKCLT
jgi:hypothetical protein